MNKHERASHGTLDLFWNHRMDRRNRWLLIFQGGLVDIWGFNCYHKATPVIHNKGGYL